MKGHKKFLRAYNIAMLRLQVNTIYVVKAGQTLWEIAETLGTSAFLLARANDLTEEPFAGQILRVPKERGNLYTVSANDTKALLCGSAENYEKKNGKAMYLGGRALL